MMKIKRNMSIFFSCRGTHEMAFSNHLTDRPFLKNGHIWFFALASIVLMGILLGVRIYVDHQRLIHLTEERLLAQARVVDENLKTHLTIVNLLLTNVIDELNANPGGINEYLQSQVKMIPGIRTIVITDFSGRSIYSNRDSLIDRDFSDRDYFKTPRNATDNTLIFLSPPFETILGKYVISITRVLTGNQGEFKGIVTLALEPEYFLTLIESTLYTPDNRIALIHSDGIIFLAMPDTKRAITGQQVMKPGSQFIRHIQDGKPVSIQTGTSATTDDFRRFVFITNIPHELHFDKHLVVGVSRSLDVVLGTWRIDSAIQISIFVLLTASAIIVTRTMLLRRTEKREVENERIKNAETNRAILDSIGSQITILNKDGIIVSVNEAWRDFALNNRTEDGKPPEHTGVGVNYLEICLKCDDEYSGQAREAYQGIKSVTDGSVRVFTMEYPCHSPDMKRWYILKAEPLRTRAGGAVIIHTDITRHKLDEAEREKLETLNWQLQKSESLGRMAGAIAHHFNNQLSAVIGNLELTMLKLSHQNDGAVKNLTAAMQATRKAATVSNLMLTYLGQTTGKCESMDISNICRQYLPMLQAGLQAHVALKTDLPSTGPIISANTNQIQQVLISLVTNASESIGNNRGTIHLTVKKVSPEDIPVFHLFPIDWKPQDTPYACIEIGDTGSGIANMDIEKIFDPFFSTKFPGRGLGLSVSLGIVKSHGGGISVASDPDQGSVFRIFLPVSAG
ncbi:MAG: ATP-binding protein [Pseudomonadota bacterium]